MTSPMYPVIMKQISHINIAINAWDQELFHIDEQDRDIEYEADRINLRLAREGVATLGAMIDALFAEDKKIIFTVSGGVLDGMAEAQKTLKDLGLPITIDSYDLDILLDGLCPSCGDDITEDEENTHKHEECGADWSMYV